MKVPGLRLLLLVCVLLPVPAAGCGDDVTPSNPDAGDLDAGDRASLLPDDCPHEVGASRYGYRVISRYDHDPDAFTQGLVFEREEGVSVLYEGTGLVGGSSLRRVLLETGEVTRNRDLRRPFFGEGIVIWDGVVTQLTWRSRVGFRYQLETFEPIDSVTFETEGWGLTHDGARLIMSDGTSTLRFRDPDSFVELSTVQVTLGGEPVRALNELEYIQGLVWANVWRTDIIVLIDPATGFVVGELVLSGLLESAHPDYRGADVLNGIAFDAEDSRLFVTGKLWPSVFEIELICARSR